MHRVGPSTRDLASAIGQVPMRTVSSGINRNGILPVAKARPRVSAWQIIGAMYQWATWSFICGMVCSQFLCIIWNTTSWRAVFHYGQNPRNGIAPIRGFNDAPYSDRVVVCTWNNAGFQPMLVSQVLASDMATCIGTTGTERVGYRLIRRQLQTAIDPGVYQTYRSSCDLIGHTLDRIFDGCSTLGYSNLTKDYLRVVDDYNSLNTYAIHNSLPVLIMPYWDNGPYARYAIPTLDGDACVFRLLGAYSELSAKDAVFCGANKSTRHERTVEWLKRPNGSWKNGWYEDPSGVKWGSEVLSTYSTSKYHMLARQFDMLSGNETDCLNSNACDSIKYTSRWGPKFITVDHYFNIDSIYIGNGTQYGLFEYKCGYERIVQTPYDWETLLSNCSVALLLARWMLSMLVLHRGYYTSQTKWHSGGIGCVAGAQSFTFLPLAVLPRLKTTLCAFWTIGCNFEGEQSGLSEAWFAIYPAIVEFVLVYYSVLNTIAKISRRRITDKLFAPTIIILSVIHYYRIEVAQSGWLKNVDSRVATMLSSSEINKLKLLDLFTPSIALRINGNVYELYALKVALIAVNLLPLLLARTLKVDKDIQLADKHSSGVERALAIRICNVGGLGQSLRFTKHWFSKKSPRVQASAVPMHNANQNPLVLPIAVPRNTDHHDFLDSYELIRLGYVVYGNKYVLKFDDWDIISTFTLLRAFFHLWNYRSAVWTLENDTTQSDYRVLRNEHTEMCRLDDPRLLAVAFWDISACDIE